MNVVAALVLSTLFLPLPVFAMGDKPDENCWSSDSLRFVLAGENFSIPRKDVAGFSCTHSSLEKECSVKGRKICQGLDAPPFKISRISIRKVYPIPPTKEKCDSRVSFSLSLSLRPEPVESDTALIPRLQEDCKENKFYRNYCRHYFRYRESIVARMQYDHRCYPPSRIKELIDSFRAVLKQ